MDDRARLIALWCRQAEKTGAFNGDVNFVQLLALEILDAVDRAHELEIFKGRNEFLDNMFMGWLAVEHRKIYDSIQEERKQQEDKESYVDLADLAADDMKELILKMRRQFGMESDGGRH